MTPASVEAEIWPRKRWWAAVVLALGLQIGLVLWLADRSPITARSPTDAPVVFPAESPLTRLPTLADPLLFSPANPHSFSGAVWMNTPKLEYQVSDWTSPPGFLALPANQLTNAFSTFIKTNSSSTFAAADSPAPKLPSPQLSRPGAAITPESRLRIQGDLERREMIMPVALPGWPHTDVLSNSVVEVLVDLDGNTVSANLVTSCGLKTPDKDPDQYALNVARALRFQSIHGIGPATASVTSLAWGKLVFEWQTVALPATNLPSQKP